MNLSKMPPISVLSLDGIFPTALMGALKTAGLPAETVTEPAQIQDLPLLMVTARQLLSASAPIAAQWPHWAQALQARQGRHRPTLLLGAAGAQATSQISLPGHTHPHLGLLPGRLTPLPQSGPAGQPLKTPLTGWFRPKIQKPSKLLPHRADFYFSQGFSLDLGSAWDDLCRASLENGLEIPVLVQSGALTACLFYPQFSGQNGVKLLKRWAALQHDGGR